MTQLNARPDAPAWARAWPIVPGLISAVSVLVGLVGATMASTAGDHGVALMWLGGGIALGSAVAWVWSSAVESLRSSRRFWDAEDARHAWAACVELERAGADYLVPEAWDNLSRASLGGHHDVFQQLCNRLAESARTASLRDPSREMAIEFMERTRMLDEALREQDPKPLD